MPKRTNAKARPKRRARPLRADAYHLKARPRRTPRAAVTNPLFDIPRRTFLVYAEMPSRLAGCRSPFDVWAEAARLWPRLLAAWSVR